MDEDLTNHLRIEADDLARLALINRTGAEISQKITEEFIKKLEFREMVNSIKIDLNDVRERVERELVNRIIQKWAEEVGK